jgi:hypothetical protein
MPRVCTVCSHAEREAIDAALVAGEPFRRIAARFTLSDASVRRHKADHLPAALAQAKAAEDADSAIDLMGQLKRANRMAWEIAEEARAKGPNGAETALKALDRVQRQLELVGKLLGQLQEAAPVVNVLVTTPEWLTLQGRLLAVLDDHPEAKRAVVEAWDNGRIS